MGNERLYEEAQAQTDAGFNQTLWPSDLGDLVGGSVDAVVGSVDERAHIPMETFLDELDAGCRSAYLKGKEKGTLVGIGNAVEYGVADIICTGVIKIGHLAVKFIDWYNGDSEI